MDRAAASQPRGIRVEESIAIAAPGNRVWRLFATLEDWSGWNPMHPQAAGRWIVGKTLDVTVALPGAKPRDTHPVVTAIVPGRELRYRTASFGGLVQSHRYFLIETAGPSDCRFVNGETLGGPLGGVVAIATGARIRAGLRLMNRALKDLAERG